MDDLPTFDGRQLTAARALAEMTVAALAEKADVTPRTVHRIEIGGPFSVSPSKRHGHISADVWNRIVTALQEAGVELTTERGGHGAGARWLQPRRARD
ncbi:MAG: helix-turn-helix domain-containing protein [Hyphomicrobium zavarzinii]|uniref:helix-turn-helix domain-containing protein n=1 Tax=Hyphomicrobium zavarzinii TaxID=48292 RepID=UPI001A442008|nr:helix-turn-helix transcriptional regulator [Hyphomicrobium zavarzinii]MBL8845452.1 helix-turn-helix domain-containing protein [Hyphomicrobium zavarzinii]